MLTLIEHLGRGKLSENHKTITNNAMYECSCGDIFKYNISLINQHNRTECIKCRDKQLEDILGKNYPRIKKVWYYMMDRCYNKSNKSYNKYGGSGVIVCKEWHDFRAFEEWSTENNYTEEPRVHLDKDFKSWALNTKPIYSPSGAMFILASKNSILKKLLIE